jgi:hypothetical protein
MIAINSLKTVLMALLMSQPALVFAQSMPGQWVGDLYLVIGNDFPFKSHFVDDKNHVSSTIPNIASAVDFPIPYNYLKYAVNLYWRNDALYTLAFGAKEKNEDGSEFSRYTIAKWEDDKWHFLGDFKTDTNEILKAIPCDNDRFIVISKRKDLIDNNRIDRSPFHRMSKHPSKTEIRLDTSIGYGSVMDDLKKYMSEPTCFELAYNSKVIVTDDYAILVNCKTGLYWIFSLEKATLKYSGTIFKKLTPEMIAKGGFTDAILCANPVKDGTVLLSAQEEAAFMTGIGDAQKEIKQMLDDNPDLSPADALRIWNERIKDLAVTNPLLVWYRIYPENGKVEKLSPWPLGAAPIRDGKTDIWRPLSDGSVRMGLLNPIVDDDQKGKNEKPSASDKLQPTVPKSLK